jgi:hypothetical protein
MSQSDLVPAHWRVAVTPNPPLFGAWNVLLEIDQRRFGLDFNKSLLRLQPYTVNVDPAETRAPFAASPTDE